MNLVAQKQKLAGLVRPVNSSRHHLRNWVARASREVASGERVLDAGAGEAPYRDLFSHVVYETADFTKVEKKSYGEIDYVCDLRSIPVEDERYDLVLCTQVLEHMPEPATLLAELIRVTKPGGGIWMSAPLFFEEHETPYDFYRYTRFAYEYLAESTGVALERIQWLEGYYGTLSYQLTFAVRHLRGLSMAPVRALFLVLAHLFSYLDRTVDSKRFGMPKNYACVFRKPIGPGQ